MTRMAIFAKDVRHGDVLLEQRSRVIHHLEHDVDINDEAAIAEDRGAHDISPGLVG